jgi:hypothetical protein
MKIDFTYIINLNTPNTEIKNKIDQIPFGEEMKYYILAATNGWQAVEDPTKSRFKFKLADWWNSDKFGDESFYNRDVTPGEAGCMLSHYECILNGYEDDKQNNILIFEEDFVPRGKFPTAKVLSEVPADCSILYLDRSAKDPDSDIKISKNVTEVGYSYNNHAYIVTKKGMKEIVESSILDNIIVSDEFFPAINGTSRRLDAVKKFHNPKFKAYALNESFFGQTSNPDIDSLTEFTPEEVNAMKKTK